MYYFIFLIFFSSVLSGVNNLHQFLIENKNSCEQESFPSVDGEEKYSPEVLVALMEESEEVTLLPLKQLSGKIGWCRDNVYLVNHPQLEVLPNSSKENFLGIFTRGDFSDRYLKKEEITLLSLACSMRSTIGKSTHPQTVFIIGVNSSDSSNNSIVNNSALKKKLEKINEYMADEKKNHAQQFFFNNYKVYCMDQEEKKIEDYIKKSAIVNILKINPEGFFEIKDEENSNETQGENILNKLKSTNISEAE